MNSIERRGTCHADDLRRTPRTDPPARRAYGLPQIVLLLALTACSVCAAGCGDGGNSAPPAPPVPDVTTLAALSVRASLVNPSRGVLRVHNVTDRPLPGVRVELNDLDRQQGKVVDLDLGAGEVTEIGWAEGWSLGTHDRIWLRRQGYANAVFETYKAPDGGVGIRPSPVLDEIRAEEQARRDDERVRRAMNWVGWAAGLFPVGIGVIVLVSWLRTRREHGSLGRGA